MPHLSHRTDTFDVSRLLTISSNAYSKNSICSRLTSGGKYRLYSSKLKPSMVNHSPSITLQHFFPLQPAIECYKYLSQRLGLCLPTDSTTANPLLTKHFHLYSAHQNQVFQPQLLRLHREPLQVSSHTELKPGH